VTKRQYLDFQRSSRSEQSDQPAPDQSAKLDHQAEALPNSLLFTSRIGLAVGTAGSEYPFAYQRNGTMLFPISFHFLPSQPLTCA
jgi:hypothetical protein